jgi:putative tryptophan/tyrosine transport system substrate-binding protein
MQLASSFIFTMPKTGTRLPARLHNTRHLERDTDQSPVFLSERELILELATHHSVPVMYFDRIFTVSGGLMSYGASLAELFRQSGVYVGRILKGEKPAHLPVQQPTKFELVINLNTAKQLGLSIPPMLIARADEVIE